MIKVVLVDDEPQSCKALAIKLKAVADDIEIIGTFHNPEKAIAGIRKQKPAAVFLDIEMPGMNGFQLLEKMEEFDFEVIFVTAYDEYTLHALRISALDYLLKPVTFERFLKAVNKVSQPGNLKTEVAPIVEEKKNDAFVYFRADRKMVKVMLQDISYIESMKDYVKIVTSNGVIITKQSISSVDAMLPEKNFIRILRSFIVSLHKIKTFTAELIEIDKTEMPIGKLYRNGVMKVLG